MRRYTSRTSRTCSSSPSAAIPAHWTNSCGAVPTDGLNARSASETSGGAQTKPQRIPVIDERFESVLKTTTFSRSATWSAETGSSPNQISEYASSEQSRKPCSRASSASSS